MQKHFLLVAAILGFLGVAFGAFGAHGLRNRLSPEMLSVFEIGVMLVGEAFGQHIDKGYIYFAMAFSLGVEFINMRLRAKTTPVDLRHSEMPTEK